MPSKKTSGRTSPVALVVLLGAVLLGLASCGGKGPPEKVSSTPLARYPVKKPVLGPAEDAAVTLRIGGKSRLSHPRSIAVDERGDIFVSDTENGRVVKFDSSGREIATIGRKGPNPGEFQEPWPLAATANGVVVLDPRTGWIQTFGADGKLVKKMGEGFYSPHGLAVSRDGAIAVADTGNNRVVVFAPDGTRRELTALDGEKFAQPTDVTFDAEGRLYVVLPTDGNGTLARFVEDGKPQTAFAIAAVPSTIDTPRAAVGPDGRVYVTDIEQGRLIAYAPDGSTAAPLRLSGGPEPGFKRLAGITVDSRGRIYVVDTEAGVAYRIELARKAAGSAPAPPPKP